MHSSRLAFVRGSGVLVFGRCDCGLPMFGWFQDKIGRLAGRSPKWPAVRAKYLREHPACEVCGATENNAVHHRLPYHLFPAKELDPDNLQTLCDEHHLLVGHLMSWKSYNPNSREDAAAWRNKIDHRP